MMTATSFRTFMTYICASALLQYFYFSRDVSTVLSIAIDAFDNMCTLFAPVPFTLFFAVLFLLFVILRQFYHDNSEAWIKKTIGWLLIMNVEESNDNTSGDQQGSEKKEKDFNDVIFDVVERMKRHLFEEVCTTLYNSAANHSLFLFLMIHFLNLGFSSMFSLDVLLGESVSSQEVDWYAILEKCLPLVFSAYALVYFFEKTDYEICTIRGPITPMDVAFVSTFIAAIVYFFVGDYVEGFENTLVFAAVVCILLSGSLLSAFHYFTLPKTKLLHIWYRQLIYICSAFLLLFAFPLICIPAIVLVSIFVDKELRPIFSHREGRDQQIDNGGKNKKREHSPLLGGLVSPSFVRNVCFGLAFCGPQLRQLNVPVSTLLFLNGSLLRDVVARGVCFLCVVAFLGGATHYLQRTTVEFIQRQPVRIDRGAAQSSCGKYCTIQYWSAELRVLSAFILTISAKAYSAALVREMVSHAHFHDLQGSVLEGISLSWIPVLISFVGRILVTVVCYRTAVRLYADLMVIAEPVRGKMETMHCMPVISDAPTGDKQKKGDAGDTTKGERQGHDESKLDEPKKGHAGAKIDVENIGFLPILTLKRCNEKGNPDWDSFDGGATKSDGGALPKFRVGEYVRVLNAKQRTAKRFTKKKPNSKAFIGRVTDARRVGDMNCLTVENGTTTREDICVQGIHDVERRKYNFTGTAFDCFEDIKTSLEECQKLLSEKEDGDGAAKRRRQQLMTAAILMTLIDIRDGIAEQIEQMCDTRQCNETKFAFTMSVWIDAKKPVKWEEMKINFFGRTKEEKEKGVKTDKPLMTLSIEKADVQGRDGDRTVVVKPTGSEGKKRNLIRVTFQATKDATMRWKNIIRDICGLDARDKEKKEEEDAKYTLRGLFKEVIGNAKKTLKEGVRKALDPTALFREDFLRPIEQKLLDAAKKYSEYELSWDVAVDFTIHPKSRYWCNCAGQGDGEKEGKPEHLQLMIIKDSKFVFDNESRSESDVSDGKKSSRALEFLRKNVVRQLSTAPVVNVKEMDKKVKKCLQWFTKQRGRRRMGLSKAMNLMHSFSSMMGRSITGEVVEKVTTDECGARIQNFFEACLDNLLVDMIARSRYSVLKELEDDSGEDDTATKSSGLPDRFVDVDDPNEFYQESELKFLHHLLFQALRKGMESTEYLEVRNKLVDALVKACVAAKEYYDVSADLVLKRMYPDGDIPPAMESIDKFFYGRLGVRKGRRSDLKFIDLTHFTKNGATGINHENLVEFIKVNEMEKPWSEPTLSFAGHESLEEIAKKRRVDIAALDASNLFRALFPADDPFWNISNRDEDCHVKIKDLAHFSDDAYKERFKIVQPIRIRVIQASLGELDIKVDRARMASQEDTLVGFVKAIMDKDFNPQMIKSNYSGPCSPRILLDNEVKSLDKVIVDRGLAKKYDRQFSKARTLFRTRLRLDKAITLGQVCDVLNLQVKDSSVKQKEVEKHLHGVTSPEKVRKVLQLDENYRFKQGEDEDIICLAERLKRRRMRKRRRMVLPSAPEAGDTDIPLTIARPALEDSFIPMTRDNFHVSDSSKEGNSEDTGSSKSSIQRAEIASDSDDDDDEDVPEM